MDIFKHKISNSAKLFYIYLQTFKQLDKKNKDYAEVMNVTTMSIVNWLKELQSVKLIKIEYFSKSRKIKL
jgi:Mn-dependent DtxR family transcriptional regulator